MFSKYRLRHPRQRVYRTDLTRAPEAFNYKTLYTYGAQRPVLDERALISPPDVAEPIPVPALSRPEMDEINQPGGIPMPPRIPPPPPPAEDMTPREAEYELSKMAESVNKAEESQPIENVVNQMPISDVKVMNKRLNLLEQIRQGKQLKKAEARELKPVSEQPNMMASLASELAKRRKAIEGGRLRLQNDQLRHQMRLYKNLMLRARN